MKSRDRKFPQSGASILVSVLLIAGFAVSQGSAHGADRKIVGALARVDIVEAGIEFVGRVDTGAKTTSINAQDITAANGRVSYRLVNDEGKSRNLSSEIVKRDAVKNADAREERYFIYLTLRYQQDTKKILVNLNDRSASTYKLLLGRNWLSGSYLVDVDQ